MNSTCSTLLPFCSGPFNYTVGKSMLLCVALGLLQTNTSAQILFTESFTVILDTTKRVQGTVIPDLRFETLKENLIEVENHANFSFRLKGNALTIANKLEFSRLGREEFLSGGYLYLEVRRVLRGKFALEPFGQFHWADPRGLDRKYATGLYTRFRMVSSQNIGFFAGIGPFYEFERWDYRAVSDQALIPPGQSFVETSLVKLGSYINFKFEPHPNVFFDFSTYHQSRLEEVFTTPRIANSSAVTYSFANHLGVTLMYQNIYDFQPTVPIDNWYHNVVSSLSISF